MAASGKIERLVKRLIATLIVCGVIAAGIVFLPLGTLLGRLEWVQTPLAVLVIVGGLGKLLYDTLFYDRYL